MRPLHAVVLGAIGMAFVAAGCAGAVPSTDGGPATLKLMTTKDGSVLTDGQGHTLYLFAKDASGESYCTDACAAVWPPLETSAMPTGSGGIDTGALGTIKRGNGEMQVTYHGHPLYYYAADASTAGRTTGEALSQFGSVWYLVGSNGKPLATAQSSGSGSSGSGSKGSGSGSSGGSGSGGSGSGGGGGAWG